MLRTTSFTIILGALVFFANTVEAASLFFTPGTGEFGLNKEISLDIKIDSDGVGINAAQATIRFPKDSISVKSISKADSAFNFWLEEPTFSNDDGVISFIGGTPYGVAGGSIQVLHVVFTTNNSGVATVNIVDAAVTSSDGSGTNVLSKTTDAAFTVSPEKVAATITPATVVTPPVQIIRVPAVATGLPSKPVLTIPLYPNPAEWSNHSNVFTVAWELPRDITNIATAINKQPNFTPTISEGLFDSKMFQQLADGVWYLHVQFKNEIGWGAVAHYRIAVDTKAPLPFEITSTESELSDNPTPTYNFKASDALSGMREYRIRIDNENLVTIAVKDFKGSYKLNNQTPGKHRLVVQAVDNANNSIENTVDYEILPLALPIFTFVTGSIFSEESKGITARGTALPSTEILLSLKRGTEVIENIVVAVDSDGKWEYTFSNTIRNGNYIVSAQNRDARGALSLIIDSTPIKVSGKYTNLIIFLISFLTVALFAGFWFYERRREKTALRINVAESDTSKVFKMIENDIEKLKNARDTATPADDDFVIQKMQENVKKMSGYIKDEISKANK